MIFILEILLTDTCTLHILAVLLLHTSTTKEQNRDESIFGHLVLIMMMMMMEILTISHINKIF